MKSKKIDDEIDLIEIIQIIWESKWKIVLIIGICILIMLGLQFNKKTPKLVYQITTDIKSITTFDEFKYHTFNSYVENIGGNQNYFPISKDKLFSPDTMVDQQIKSNIIQSYYYDFSANVNFNKITKLYLLNLFIEKLSENSVLAELVKNSDFIKRDNFKNQQNYESEVNKIVSSIKIYMKDDNNIGNQQPTFYIQSQSEDVNKWKEMLYYIENYINDEIKQYLVRNLNELVENGKKFKQYRIEDLTAEIASEDESDEQLKYLKQLRQKLLMNKDIERLEKIYLNTPIFNGEDFIAAKFMIKSSEYKSLNKIENKSLSRMLLLSICIGGILGIFYVLISNSIKSRS